MIWSDTRRSCPPSPRWKRDLGHREQEEEREREIFHIVLQTLTHPMFPKTSNNSEQHIYIYLALLWFIGCIYILHKHTHKYSQRHTNSHTHSHINSMYKDSKTPMHIQMGILKKGILSNNLHEAYYILCYLILACIVNTNTCIWK